MELADRAYQALLANDYGQYDHLIATLSGSLGDAGLAHLKQRLVTLSNKPIKKTRGSREAQNRLVVERSDI
ncbi:hypothetical+protein [Methylocapsa aurea]